jgi:hypothetical protein
MGTDGASSEKGRFVETTFMEGVWDMKIIRYLHTGLGLTHLLVDLIRF